MLLSNTAQVFEKISQPLKKLLGLTSVSLSLAKLSRQASHSASHAKGSLTSSQEAVKQRSSQEETSLLVKLLKVYNKQSILPSS